MTRELSAPSARRIPISRGARHHVRQHAICDRRQEQRESREPANQLSQQPRTAYRLRNTSSIPWNLTTGAVRSTSRTACAIVCASAPGCSVVRSDIHRLGTTRTLGELLDELIELGAGLLIDAALLHILGHPDDGKPGIDRHSTAADAVRSGSFLSRTY